MDSFITISQVMQWLGYADPRPALLWCEKHDVFVMIRGKAKLVNRAQFTLAFYQPFLNHLRKKFPDSWAEMFRLYLNGAIEELAGLTTSSKQSVVTGRYKPASQAEIDFLNKMREL